MEKGCARVLHFVHGLHSVGPVSTAETQQFAKTKTRSAATSILSPAREQIMEEFHVGSTVALLPVVLYVFALGFGPIIGGPLSETVGRLPVFLIMMPVGALFTLGAGFCHNLGALCFTRFMAGFFWGPLLAVPSATLVETFPPKSRGPPTATFILMPFLGPGLG